MTEEQIQYIPLADIDPDPDQPRRSFDPELLQGLAETLKEVGQQAPIRVRLVNGRFMLVDGERRLRAAKLAGFTKIAVIVENKDLSRGETTLRQFIANCQREDLNDVDKSDALQVLMQETGCTASTLACKTGISNSTLSRLVALGQLSEPIREKVRRGEISLSAASTLARVEDKEAQAALASQVASGTLTRDALAGVVKAQRRAKGSTPPGPNRVFCKLTSGGSVTVSADSLDLEDFITALEEVLAKARKARTQGIEVSTLAKMFRDQARA